MKDFKPIFIVGVGRSGTSMLQGMLNAHHAITFPPETHFIRTYLPKKVSLKEVRTELINDETLTRLGLPLEQIVEKSKDLKEFYTNLLFEYMKKQGKAFVGDKDPKNIEHLQDIHSIFPKANIVHIYRDPRAVIASRLKAKWSADKPFWQHLLAYKAQLAYGRKVAKQLFKSYIELKYEVLVENPVYVLKGLCTELGLQYDENMIEFYKNAGELVQEKELSWKENCFNPVMMENIDKWKKELTQEQVGLIEYVLSDEMNMLGYDKSLNQSLMYKMKKCYYKTFIAIISKLYSFKLN